MDYNKSLIPRMLGIFGERMTNFGQNKTNKFYRFCVKISKL